MAKIDPKAWSLAWRVGVMLGLFYVAWIGMQAVHEAGHAVVAWSTGGTVTNIELPLLGISRTDVRPNPRPLAVAWAGPIVGAIVPLAAMWCVRLGSRTSDDATSSVGMRRQLLSGWVELFAGFCLIVNGAYVGVGSFERIGDAGDLLRYGASQWQLVVFGITAVLAGLLVWHLALESYRGQLRGNDPPERNSSDSP